MGIGVQELLVLLIAFALPVALAAPAIAEHRSRCCVGSGRHAGRATLDARHRQRWPKPT
jgi:hypothetical protein